MTDDQLWRHHAYVYAWRRVYLGVTEATSPLDQAGEFYNPQMVAKAERILSKGREQRQRPPKASGPDAVRMDLDAISWNDMTQPERDIMRPRFLEMASALKSAIAAAAARMKRATWSRRAPDPPLSTPAKEIAPPPGFETRAAYLDHTLAQRQR